MMDIIGVSPTLLSGDVLTHLRCNGKINAVHYPGSMHKDAAMKIPILADMVWSRVNGPVPLAVTGRPSTMSIKVLLRRLVERQVERQGVNTIVAGGHNVEEPGDGQSPSIFSPTPQRKGNRTRGNSPPRAASMRMRRPAFELALPYWLLVPPYWLLIPWS